MNRLKTIRPTRTNAGIEAAYRKALAGLITEMQASVVYWLRAKYRANEPEVAQLAQDAIPASELHGEIRRLRLRWTGKIDDIAMELATKFAKGSKGHAERGFKSSMKQSGMTIEYTESPAILDAYRAVVNENVGLIKSIPAQYFTEIEGDVMRSIQHGRDLGFLSKQLTERYGVTQRRAALIARDQSNKANAVMTRVRHQEVGIKQALWMHSHGGRHPRPSHVAMDGKPYDIAVGAMIEGERIWPGEKINCRCFAKAIVPGLS